MNVIIAQLNQKTTDQADSFLIGTVEVFPVEAVEKPFIVSEAGETFLFISANLSPDQARAEAIKFLGV